MEDSTSYSSLKQSLASIPAKVISYSSRNILSNNLDFKQVLSSRNGYCRDYRGLAELMNLQRNTIKIFEGRNVSTTEQILDTWETQPNATLDKLIEYLEEMERHDIIKELIPSLERSAKTYMESQLQEIPIQDPEVSAGPESMYPERSMQVFTRDDLTTGECTYYDAYVSYADEDCLFVEELARILESPEIGFKLFIRGRDLLAGYAEHDTNIMLIKQRCRRMLIVLSPNFLKSRACEFQTSFAAGLAIDQQRRMLIPIFYAPCETPLILRYVSKIDFTKPDVKEWVWGKLISSLRPEVSSSLFTPSLHRILQQETTALAPLPSSETTPMITYPPTTKYAQSSLNYPCISISSPWHPVIHPKMASIDTSDEVLKNSTAPVKASSSIKKWKFPWHIKGRSGAYSSSHSVSSSSNATSGFHSQSDNTFENLESCIEDSSSDTPV